MSDRTRPVSQAWRRRVIAAAAGLVVLAACGGDGPSAREWASRVCSALQPWRTQIVALTAEAQEQMASAGTATQTRENLLRLFAGARAASESARAAVAAAGVPDVAGGAEVSRRFVEALAGTRDAYARAADELQALSTEDAAGFYDGVVGIMTRLNAAYAASGVDTTRLESVQLRAAFDEVEQCH